MPVHDIAKLNEIYSQADSCDKELFAEQRSNVLLCSSEHYKKVSDAILGRFKDVKEKDSTKLRLTKNHTAVITNIYRSAIVNGSPSVKILPSNPSERADAKGAELNDAVVQDLKRRHKLRDRIRDFAQDFVEIGECAVRIYWDDQAGKLVGYKQATNEMGSPIFKDSAGNDTLDAQAQEVDPITGLPLADEMGQPKIVTHEPKASNEPVFEGDFKFERILAFNLLRDKNAQSMDESPYLGIRRMVDIEVAKGMIPADDPDRENKLKFIQESSQSTFKVFDAHKGQYQDGKGQVMFREWYWKPCAQYPNGFFYITTEHGILFSGELPFGIFPIVYAGFDKIQTSPRARSIIKRLRPYQAEINRAASELATAQMSLTPKLLMQAGTKLSKGGELPGVRALYYTGATPTIMNGYSGEGYLAYLNSRVDEMYRVAQVAEAIEEAPAQLDPYTLLYRSLKQKQKHSLYIQTFESFVVEMYQTVLKLARHYYDETKIIRAAGRREQINVDEFKQTDELDYVIRVEPMSDDTETALGKQLTFNHILQYLGPQLPKEAIGKVLRAAPFLNKDDAFDDFTMNEDAVKNDLLQLDRGKQVPVRKHSDHKFYINRLIHRMSQADYEFLPVEVQKLYEDTLSGHEQAEADRLEELQRAQAGFIPTGGGLVKCDLTETDPQRPGATRRMMFPAEALMDLKKKLEKQGTTQDMLAQMNPQALIDIAGKMSLDQVVEQGQNQIPQQQDTSRALGTDLRASLLNRH